ncbi:MAG: metallophosphoesterase, partial [Deltaproteobacteria bacterium]|nr:metallophosphoesterase [Deltaproteobacteria bacterium]
MRLRKLSQNKTVPVKKMIKSLLALLFTAVVCNPFQATAGNPGGAHYSAESGNIFWFVLISDTHMGESGSADSDNLGWAVNEAVDIIEPEFVINLGDLTDQHPFGSNQDTGQWNDYRAIVDHAGMGNIYNGVPVYSDVPGNHDQYHENPPLANYLIHSIQGRATNSTQRSWLFEPGFGKYHFVTVASPDPDMTSPVWDFLNGCPGEISHDEHTFIMNALSDSANVDADLTFVFGHHGLGQAWGSIEIGLTDFVSTLGQFGVSMYAYGHTHADSYEPPYFED